MFSNARNLSAVLQALGDAFAGEVPLSSPSLGLAPATARDLLRPLWVAADASILQGCPWEMFRTADGYLVRGKVTPVGGGGVLLRRATGGAGAGQNSQL
jgi:hypothetical protein